ncbi:MAG: EamA family transporter [Pseudomonadota bacterium]
MEKMLGLWWLLAMMSGVGLATRNILFKVANAKIDPALGAVVLSVSMGLATIAYFIGQRAISGEPFIPEGGMNMQGVMLAAVSGLGVAGANIFLAYAYKAGGQASLVGLLQNGFSLTLTILIGVLVLSEVIKPMQGVGIILALVGMFFIIKG